ncbi:MAG: hypothetical protein ACYDHT_02170, partial [Solirubrobacteraceae bacterium]
MRAPAADRRAWRAWLVSALVCVLGCSAAIGSPLALGTTKARVARTILSPATLVVPAGNGAAPFNTTRKLNVPTGWGAEVWARVSNARFAAWTPLGHLLVSSASSGQIVELTPGAGGGAASQRTLTSGLTSPQGLAFDSLEGSEVLYVAESNQLDRYVWTSAGTLGARTVLVKGLPDQSKAG